MQPTRPEPRSPVPITLERTIGAAAMGLICLISIANVVVRYATNVSFAFTEEFSVVLLVILTFVGASAAFASDGHISIVFIRDLLPRPMIHLCRLLAYLASLTMFGLVLWYSGWLAYDEYLFGETSPGLGYPTWIYTVWLPVLALAAMLRILERIWRLLRGVR